MSTPHTSQITVLPVSGLIGAEVMNVNLRDALTDDVVTGIRRALTDYGVVFFSGQAIGPAEHVALATALGEIKLPPDYFPETLRDQGFPEISVISTDNQLAYTTDNWHADVTWLPNPPRYSILHMQQLPPAGGDTLWSSQYAAYEWLSEPMKQLLDPLTARHQLPGFPDRWHDHPVVCRNPLSGRKALFVNGVFCNRINELTADESSAVLSYLKAHTTRPEFICRWRWTDGDVAIWDNHYVQHYAVADYRPHPRKIHRIEVVGEPPVPAA
jgi:taurine dioxygenase